ncbi:TerC family protein [Ferviditalea candida]|uniref:Uncharacterized protein n=1 Tax=Ferviditalea candida TaxID=3108399 RepID=A0ABU5ZP77_9BACL|nr:hypothetical protein [Paenibacillaceae bacterium T2]
MEILQFFSLEEEPILYTFLLFLFNNVINLLIITSFARKYTFKPREVLIYSVLMLTISRTFYFVMAPKLAETHGLQLISGIFLLIFVIHMITKQRKKVDHSDLPRIPVIVMLFIAFATDYSICFENIRITAQLSNNFLEVAFGLLLSLIGVFILFRIFTELFMRISFFAYIASGLLAEVSIMGMHRDPLFQKGLQSLQVVSENIPGFINRHISILAIDVAILIMIIGIVNQLKHRS